LDVLKLAFGEVSQPQPPGEEKCEGEWETGKLGLCIQTGNLQVCQFAENEFI